MTVAKKKIMEIMTDLPEEIDIDEVMYRLYLLQKIEHAEKDIREGKVLTHEEVVAETARWQAK